MKQLKEFAVKKNKPSRTKSFLSWIFFSQFGNRVLLLSIFMLVAGILLYVAHAGVDFGACKFKQLTGLNCISCGATRATLCLLRLDFVGAFYYNPLILLLYGLLIAWYCYCLFNAFRKPKHYKNPLQIHSAILFTFLAVAVLFGFIRNLSFYKLYFY